MLEVKINLPKSLEEKAKNLHWRQKEVGRLLSEIAETPEHELGTLSKEIDKFLKAIGREQCKNTDLADENHTD